MSSGVLVAYSSSSSDDETSISETLKCALMSEGRDQGNNACGLMRIDSGEGTHASQCNDRRQNSVVPRLPIPESLLHMFKDETEEESHEDVTRHGGRVRNFPHARGNWATYVYMPYEPIEEFLDLLDIVIYYAHKCGIALIKMEEFHISLSRTVILRHHWISPFIQSLRERLVPAHRFVCIADRLEVYTNEEKNSLPGWPMMYNMQNAGHVSGCGFLMAREQCITQYCTAPANLPHSPSSPLPHLGCLGTQSCIRTFLGLKVSSGYAELQDMVLEVDRVLQEFDLEVFYKDPSFHLSLAWCVGDVSKVLKGKCLLEMQEAVDGYEDSARLLRFHVEEVRCKAGNKIFSVPLR